MRKINFELQNKSPLQILIYQPNWYVLFDVETYRLKKTITNKMFVQIYIDQYLTYYSASKKNINSWYCSFWEALLKTFQICSNHLLSLICNRDIPYFLKKNLNLKFPLVSFHHFTQIPFFKNSSLDFKTHFLNDHRLPLILLL